MMVTIFTVHTLNENTWSVKCFGTERERAQYVICDFLLGEISDEDMIAYQTGHVSLNRLLQRYCSEAIQCWLETEQIEISIWNPIRGLFDQLRLTAALLYLRWKYRRGSSGG